MVYRVLANCVLLFHLLFIVFVFVGAFLVLKRRWVMWLHIPVALWGGFVEVSGWYCPLPPLENWFLRLGGQAGYNQGFVERYLLGAIYPDGLTRTAQIFLGTLVVLINGVVYGYIIAQACRRRQRKD